MISTAQNYLIAVLTVIIMFGGYLGLSRIMEMDRVIAALQAETKQVINAPTIKIPVVKRTFLHYDLCNTDQQSDKIAWRVPADMKAVVVKIYSRTGRLIDSYQLPNMFIDVQPEQTITLETK